LRQAKDRAEFEQFMQERAPAASLNKKRGTAVQKRVSACGIVALLMAIAPLPALAQQQAPPPDWYWGWGPWQFWWICPLMMLVMLAVAATIFLAFHRSAGGGHHVFPWWRNPHETALQILNERFARGEIDQAEFEERRRLLQA
jgi:putative membrane protein